MGIFDFLKDKLGSGGSGTVTTMREDAEEVWVKAKEAFGQKENLEGAIIQIKDFSELPKTPTEKQPIPSYIGINGKAEMAKQLRDNPLLNAIFDEIKEFNLVQLLNTKEGEKEAREDLYRKIRTIEDIKGKIEKHIKNAESVKKREEAKKDNYGVV